MMIFACISDQGAAMSECTLTAEEYTELASRARTETLARAAGDWSGKWADVSNNEACWPES